jgi:hypothetical protein
MCKAGHWPILFENCLEFFLRTKPQNQLLPGGFFNRKNITSLIFSKGGKGIGKAGSVLFNFFPSN